MDRIVKSVCRQGRSEAHGARNNERHGCARPRAGSVLTKLRRQYGKPLSDARTPPADFFRILLEDASFDLFQIEKIRRLHTGGSPQFDQLRGLEETPGIL